MARTGRMTQDAAQAQLADVGDAIRAQFPDDLRRAQFDSHLATVRMCVDHLFDEANRTNQQ
jgi:hypothetical protein